MTAREKDEVAVFLEEAAVLDMLLAATEMSCIQGEDAPLGKSGEYEGVEVIGGIWGTVGSDSLGRRLYTVRRATVSLQSRGDAGSVGFEEEAKRLHGRLMASFSPQLGWLGSFHSHPYIHETDLAVIENGWDHLSPSDKAVMKDDAREALMLVVTVARTSGDRHGALPAEYKERGKRGIDWSCIGFGLNDISVWIRAAVRVRSGAGIKIKGSPQVSLYCPRLLGMLMPPGDSFAPLVMESVTGEAP